jgi:hypothetical protein
MREKPNVEFYRGFGLIQEMIKFYGTGEPFMRRLEESYQELKQEQSSNPSRSNLGFELWHTAATLLVFGKLTGYEDIIDNRPLRRIVNWRLLTYSTKFLVPLPEELDPYDNPEEVKRWFRENRNRLHWDEDAGRFVFASAAENGEDGSDGEK